MGWNEALLNVVRREVLRVMHRTTRRTPVIVDAYDPQTHAAKFRLMPDSVDSAVVTGWIPLHTIHTGNNYGFHAAPNIGDHGWLEFHEDDREGGTFTGATFNDKLKPLVTQAGELQYQTIWGHVLYFKQDGSLTIKNGTKQGSGGTAQNPPSGTSQQSSLTLDNQGNLTISCPGNVTISGGKIVLSGNVYLGGAGASKPAAMQGTVDSGGYSDVSNLATKVFVE